MELKNSSKFVFVLKELLLFRDKHDTILFRMTILKYIFEVFYEFYI